MATPRPAIKSKKPSPKTKSAASIRKQVDQPSDDEILDETDCASHRAADVDFHYQTNRPERYRLESSEDRENDYPPLRYRKASGNHLKMPEKQTYAKNQRNTSPRYGLKPVVFITLGIGFFIIGFYTINVYSKYMLIPAPTKNLSMIQEDAKLGLRGLYRKMHQTKYFWTQIWSQIDELFLEESLSPAVVLAVVPSDGQKTATCLIPKVQEVVSKAFEDSKAVLFDVGSTNSITARYELHDALEQLRLQHTVVIYNLEKLPSEAVMTLHGYCDNENAPYKQALIIFTMESHLNYAMLSDGNIDSDVEGQLMELWTPKVRDVDIAAIISRIAGAIVLIKPEDDSVINSVCSENYW